MCHCITKSSLYNENKETVPQPACNIDLHVTVDKDNVQAVAAELVQPHKDVRDDLIRSCRHQELDAHEMNHCVVPCLDQGMKNLEARLRRGRHEPRLAQGEPPAVV